MRVLSVLGVLLIAAGAFLFFRGGSYNTPHDIGQVGNVKLTANEQKPIPQWVSGAAVVVGLVLVVAGIPRRSA